MTALVDDEDYSLVSQYGWHPWRKSIISPYYARAHVQNGQVLYMHKLITGYKLTDHRDENGLNNQRHNLRDATHAQNLRNRGKSKKKPYSSQYKGVYRLTVDTNSKPWIAQIKINGRVTRVGRFYTEIEAAHAVDKEFIRHHGEFAKPNFPHLNKTLF